MNKDKKLGFDFFQARANRQLQIECRNLPSSFLIFFYVMKIHYIFSDGFILAFLWKSETQNNVLNSNDHRNRVNLKTENSILKSSHE